MAAPPTDYGDWPRTCAAGTLLGALLLVAGAAVTGSSFAGSLSPLNATPSPGPSSSLSGPHTVSLEWTVTAADVALLSGRPPLRALLVNGASQGPVVEATEGDTISLTLRNAQPLPISIHWHGLPQRGTPFADGAARASTRALAGGDAATWRFTASPTGTHFYHSHAGLTSTLGLHGPVVIRPRGGIVPLAAGVGDADEYAAAVEVGPPLLFTDVWSKPLADLQAGLVGRDAAFTWVGNPDALLVNGDDVSPAAGATLRLSPPPNVAAPSSANVTLRLRLVCATSLSMLNVAFHGHTVRVVASDGARLAGFATSALDINAGERYELLIRPSAEALSEGLIWMSLASRHRAGAPVGRLGLLLPSFAARQQTPGGNATPPSAPPAVPLPTQPAWNDTAATMAHLRALHAGPGVPPPPPRRQGDPPPFYLLGTQNRVGGLMRWSVNNVSFVYPSTGANDGAAAAGSDGAADAGNTPPMLDVAAAAAAGDSHAAASERGWTTLSSAPLLTSPPNASSRFARTTAAAMGTTVLNVPFNATVDLVLQNAPALNGVNEQHPWHLHGGPFWVLAWGTGDAPASLNASGQNASGVVLQQPPPLKDTITLPPAGWAWIRLRADNPGAWPLHCHIAWHFAMGMGTTLVVAPERVASAEATAAAGRAAPAPPAPGGAP